MIRLDVPGSPAPKGSSRAIMIGGRARNVPSGSNAGRDKLRSWNGEVIAACTNAVQFDRSPYPIATGHIVVACIFRFPMRKGDLRSDGTPKPSAPFVLTTKPDVDKLVRSTLDAITASGVIWRDDAQAIVLAARVYTPPGRPVLSTVLIGQLLNPTTEAWLGELHSDERVLEDMKRPTTARKEAA